MSYVFLSYVRQDADIVDQIAKELSRAGTPVWLDRQKIKPGEIWPESIRVAITNAAILVVCFSDNFFGRDRSIANEELHLAIEEFNRRTWGQPWLIPARLSDCTIPPYPIRSNLTLSEIHAVDLTATNWRAGIVEISGLFHDWESRNLHSVQPPLSSDQAKIIIGLVSRKLSINLGEATSVPQSRFGTDSFRAREMDGKGVVYCHTTGPFRSVAFYIRKGIGYYYEYKLGGSACSLGLPVSDEEIVSRDGFMTSYFEGGYIEWSQRTGVARAVSYTPKGDRSFHDLKL